MRNLLIIGLSLWLLSCGGSDDSSLHMGVATAPSNLDPRYATDATSSRINRLLYRRLVDFDANDRPVPGLADWKRLTPTHYRFTLKKEADARRFHNGGYLTARDVKATYDFILNKKNGSPHLAPLALIERIELPDEDNIDFFLKRPDLLFPAYLAVGILPAPLMAANHPFQNRPVGSGPFRFLAWPEEGKLILERQHDGQRFEFLRVRDPTVRVLKLLRGEIQMTQNDLTPELLAYLEEKPSVRIEKRPGSNFSYLGFNLQDPDTGRPEVRRAIAHAIDREAIIRYVMQNAAKPAEALLPPSHWAGAGGLTPYEYDPAKAKALLKRAGYDKSHPLKLTYKTSSDPFRIRLATVIQSQLAKTGIQVELRSYDWGTFYGDIKAGRFQIYSLAWVGIKTPDIFRHIFHSGSVPPNGANRGRYASAQADELIEQAEAAADLEQQALLYKALQALLLEELPYLPLWYEEQVFVSREEVEGYRLARDGNYDGLTHLQRQIP